MNLTFYLVGHFLTQINPRDINKPNNRKNHCPVWSNFVFEKLTPDVFQNRSTRIARIIVEKIQSGDYEVGSKLPPERILAEQMGVGRPAVREAICALQIAGIIESRPGDGTYVMNTRWSNSNMLQRENSAFSLLEEGDNPFEALEARRAVESDLVMHAAERRTDEDVIKLRELDNLMELAIKSKDFEKLLRIDRNFHQTIANAAKNTLLEKILEFLMEVMEKEIWTIMKKHYLTLDAQHHIKETIISHREILEAIIKQDKEEARTVMERHFNEIERLFE